MTRIIAVANHKGGSGKTTTTFFLGRALAEAGKRTLLIDLDDQATLTSRMQPAAGAPEVTVADVLDGRLLVEAINSHSSELDYVCADHRLAWIAARMQASSPNHAYLRQAWQRAHLTEYDYVLLDCPPSAGVLLINALALADEVIIPATPTEESYAGMLRMNAMICDIEAILNHRLRLAGVVATMISPVSRSESHYLALYEPMLIGKVPRRVGTTAEEQLVSEYREVAAVVLAQEVQNA